MAANIFSTRPINPKTARYCINDVVHLPDLHKLYLQRIKAEWLDKSIEESSRRVTEAHSPKYDPHSPTKVLGPWGVGLGTRTKTTDKELKEKEGIERDQRIQANCEIIWGRGTYDIDIETDDWVYYLGYVKRDYGLEFGPLLTMTGFRNSS